MERLTEKGVCGNWSLKGLEWKNLHTGTLITGETCEVLYGALCKLLTCEETRLTTEEIEMRTYCTMGTPCEFQRQENMNGKDTDVPAKDGWIPVEDALPEGKALACDKYGEIMIGYIDGNANGGYDCEGDGYEMFNVLAWYPLPEPYKPERSNNHDGK